VAHGRMNERPNSPAEREPAHGPRVLVVTNMYPNPHNMAFGQFVKNQTDALERLGCRQQLLIVDGWRSKWNYVKAIAAVRKEARSGRHDLIHAYYGLCGFLGVFQRRLPMVVTYCGSDLNPGFANLEKAPVLSVLIIALGQVAAWTAEICIVRSSAMRARIISRRARGDASIVTSGIDLGLFHPIDRAEARTRLGWSLERRVVLFVCADPRLPAVKRPELAQAVLEATRREIPEAELVTVAGKPQGLLNLYYSAADVLLLTSAAEGSPNAVREALACNLPVVSTNVGDVEEMLADLPNCCTAAADATELAGRVIDVLRSGRRTTSRHRVQAHSLERTSWTILEIYRRVLEKTGARGRSLPETGTTVR
jgi:glycosyltransferase involved in cell wall biosynthesis